MLLMAYGSIGRFTSIQTNFGLNWILSFPFCFIHFRSIIIQLNWCMTRQFSTWTTILQRCSRQGPLWHFPAPPTPFYIIIIILFLLQYFFTRSPPCRLFAVVVDFLSRVSYRIDRCVNVHSKSLAEKWVSAAEALYSLLCFLRLSDLVVFSYEGANWH